MKRFGLFHLRVARGLLSVAGEPFTGRAGIDLASVTLPSCTSCTSAQIFRSCISGYYSNLLRGCITFKFIYEFEIRGPACLKFMQPRLKIERKFDGW